MSEFLKFAYELLAQVVYNIAAVFAALAKLFITGWVDYFTIFRTYLPTLNVPAKILAVLLMCLLVAIPVLIVFLIVRRIMLRHQLKTDKTDNAVLYKEIARLNKQVLSLMDEKNSILALKVNAMGGTERIPYMGASALTEDTIPTVENVTGNGGPERAATADVGKAAAAAGAPVVQAVLAENNAKIEHRFPKLALVDEKYAQYQAPAYDNEISLEDFVEGYRCFAASQMGLWNREQNNKYNGEMGKSVCQKQRDCI